MELINEMDQKPKTNNKRVVIGLVLITLAGLLFADNFDVLPWNWRHYIFTWQMLLITIGLISLAKSESRSTGIVLIFIGGVFLVAKILEYPYHMHHLFFPALLFILGVLFIIRKKNQHLISGREK
jgi:hypothetical protein